MKKTYLVKYRINKGSIQYIIAGSFIKVGIIWGT